MIAIDRGPEPAPLADARAQHLPRAWVDRVHKGRPVSKLYLGGYQADGVLTQLLKRQGYRCAFCECVLRPEALEREHFRPIRGVWRTTDPVGWRAAQRPKRAAADGPFDADGYWWLAWTWENLLLGCGGCNGSSCKWNHFALAQGATPLPSMSFTIDQEQHLLLDPTREDPLPLIEWRPALDQDPWTALRWEPRPKDSRGSYTIDLLGLDLSVADLVSGHIRSNVRREAAQLRNKDVTDEELGTLQTALFSDTQPHHGASWWALIQLLPQIANRLPRPGRLGQHPTLPVWPTRPELDGLPETLQIRVRALGKQAQEAEDGPAIVADILALRPSATSAELAFMLGRAESTIQSWRP